MRLDFLRPLEERPGPYASVYVTTERDAEDAACAVALRWRATRDQLSAAGADEATLDAVEDVVTDPGRAAPGRAVFASGGQVAYTEGLPTPPIRERATWSPLPEAAPLLAQRAELLPHVRVLIDRKGADITDVGPRRERRQREDPGHGPVQRVKEGGWSQEHYQRSAMEAWKQNAKEVADTVAEAAAAVGAEMIIIGGDVRARGLLFDSLGEREKARAVIAEHGGARTGGTDEQAWAQETRRLIAERRAARHGRELAEFREGHGRGDAVDGLGDVAAALRAGQARVVLIARGTADAGPDSSPDTDQAASPQAGSEAGPAGADGVSGHLWYGPEPTQLAATQEELRDLGIPEPRRERASSVLIRAAAGTQAEVDVIDPGELALADGAGALLRFTTA